VCIGCVHADHYAFPFIKYAADGGCTHINGADVRVPPLAFPPPVPPRAPDGAAAADDVGHAAAADDDDGAGFSAIGFVGGGDDAEQPGDDALAFGGEEADEVPDLPPSKTWRNHIYWSCIEPPLGDDDRRRVRAAPTTLLLRTHARARAHADGTAICRGTFFY
jgi:hypothetical protein